MIRKLLKGLAEGRDPCNQPREQEARKFEVINQIMWLETRESESLRTQLEAATNSLALETRRTRAAELANVTAAGEMTQEAAEIWELDTVLGILEKIVGHAMFEDHKTERVEELEVKRLKAQLVQSDWAPHHCAGLIAIERHREWASRFGHRTTLSASPEERAIQLKAAVAHGDLRKLAPITQ